MIGTVSVFILCAIVVYLIGEYRGIRIGRKQMLALDQRLNREPAAQLLTINIDAQVTEACRERCAKMINEAHAAAEWRLPT